MARKLIETDCVLIRNELQAKLPAALLTVSQDRADNAVTVEPPARYFFYEHSWAMECPSVFIVGQSMDFRQAEKQANYISASSKIIISVVVEDQNQEALVIKAWRYQSALHAVLEAAVLTSADSAAKLVVTVKRAEMSPMFSAVKDPQDSTAAFRREIYLECDCDHYESL